MSTCTDVCYVELGLPPVKYLVMAKQRKFFQRLWDERQLMVDDPWTHAVKLVRATNISTSKYIDGLIRNKIDDVNAGVESVKLAVSTSLSSRRVTYRLLNPDLEVDELYLKKGNVKEIYRVAYSQFRLSGHKLAVETGRWNRRGRGRLPAEERLCPCGEVQTEMHVLESCSLTEDVRARYGYTCWTQLMRNRDTFPVPEVIYTILSRFS